MPRQLPWVNKRGGTRTTVKPPQKAPVKPRLQPDADDDFFEGTVLERPRKGKERADLEESDQGLHMNRPAYISSTRAGKETVGRSRAPSSSPPPPAAIASPPPIEYMKKCINQFELRDDEWMMVEDEFLQTAKLFTQHLHLEEYERLKKRMEENKEEPNRPVVLSVRPSEDARLKKKARDQTLVQERALKDVFLSARVGSNDNVPDQPNSIKPLALSVLDSTILVAVSTSKTTPRSRQAIKNTIDSDSDDLDTLNTRPMKQSLAPKPVAEPIPTTTTPSPFAKPSLSASTRPRPLRRPTPFDLLDEYTPKLPSSPTRPSETKASDQPGRPTPRRPASPTKVSQARSTRHLEATRKTARTFDLFDDLDNLKRELPVKEQSDRLAKRKGEKASEEKSKSRKVADDIPTFLF